MVLEYRSWLDLKIKNIPPKLIIVWWGNQFELVMRKHPQNINMYICKIIKWDVFRL